ncbi:MAG: hypothetical protein GKS00_02925 [Alphaproteobacteria bacterium]|nr:hypothetical protein [Alphaproteobacteria bacterium]
MTVRRAPVRILISARDVGAANHLSPIAKAALETTSLDTTIVAQPPGNRILMEHGLPVRTVNLPAAPDSMAPEAGQLIREAETLLDDIAPDLLLTGLSGPDLGIDEALLKVARTPHTYTLQDYEGWVVSGFDRPARTYLVSDNSSAEITRRKGVEHTQVVGWLAYTRFHTLDVAGLRKAGHAAIQTDAPTLAVFGQTIEVPGYREALAGLGHAVRNLDRPLHVIYRPHPRQTVAQADDDKAILGHTVCGEIANCPDIDVLTLIAACDVVASCFSSVGMDFAAMNAVSPKPLGTPLFLMTQSDLRALHQRDSGFEIPWAARQGAALAAQNEEELPGILASALDETTSRNLWSTAQQVIHIPHAGGNAVISSMLEDVA